MKRAIAEGRCVPSSPSLPPSPPAAGAPPLPGGWQGSAGRGGRVPNFAPHRELPSLQLSSAERSGPAAGERGRTPGAGRRFCPSQRCPSPARERRRGERRHVCGSGGEAGAGWGARPAPSPERGCGLRPLLSRTPPPPPPASARPWGGQAPPEVGAGKVLRRPGRGKRRPALSRLPPRGAQPVLGEVAGTAAPARRAGAARLSLRSPPGRRGAGLRSRASGGGCAPAPASCGCLRPGKFAEAPGAPAPAARRRTAITGARRGCALGTSLRAPPPRSVSARCPLARGARGAAGDPTSGGGGGEAWQNLLLPLKIALFCLLGQPWRQLFLSSSWCGRMGLGLRRQQQPGAAAALGGAPLCTRGFAHSQSLRVEPEIKTYVWRNTCAHSAGSGRLETRVPSRCASGKPVLHGLQIFNSSDQPRTGAPLLSRLLDKGVFDMQSLLLCGVFSRMCHLQLASFFHH